MCSLRGNRRTLFTHGQEPDFSFIQTQASSSGQQTPQLTCRHRKMSAWAGDEHQRVINTHTHTHRLGGEKDGAEPPETLVSLWIRRHSAETMETNQDGRSRVNSGCLLAVAVTKLHNYADEQRVRTKMELINPTKLFFFVYFCSLPPQVF